MRGQTYWIDNVPTGRLGIVPRPRGGDWLEQEVTDWKGDGIDTVVSLLTADETAELDLIDERAECERAGVRCLSLPIPDRGVPPSRRSVEDTVAALRSDLRAGKSVVVHCRQGIGRSSLIVAAVLVAFGLNHDQAFRQIEAARGVTVPETTAQREWVKTFAEVSVPRAQQAFAADGGR